MASQRNFTRGNPDPNPAELVFDPEKLLQKYRKKSESTISNFQKFGSFSDDEIVDIDNIGFDLKFEKSLFHSKYESDLKEIIPDLVKFQSPTHIDSIRKGKAPENTIRTSVGQHSNTFIHNLIFGSFASQIIHPAAN